MWTGYSLAALYLVELSRNEKCPWSYDLWYNVGIQDFTWMPSPRSERVREELSLEREMVDEEERKHIFFQPLLLEVYLYYLFSFHRSISRAWWRDHASRKTRRTCQGMKPLHLVNVMFYCADFTGFQWITWTFVDRAFRYWRWKKLRNTTGDLWRKICKP